MKSLEQDALKAQMVIAKSKEGKKRSTLEQLAESPSPAPTPSPTPLEGTEQFLLSLGGQELLLGLNLLRNTAVGNHSLPQPGWKVSGGMWHLSEHVMAQVEERSQGGNTTSILVF